MRTFLSSFGHAVKERFAGIRAYAIGLHVGDHGIHLVQFDHTSPKLALRAAASVRYAPDRETLLRSPRLLRECIEKAFKNQRFKGHRVVTCLPPEQLKVSVIDYKVRTGDREDEAVLKQAMERVDGGLEQWVVDYTPVRVTEYEAGERSALLAMAPRATVLAYLQQLQEAHLQVEALEIGPVAISRLVTCISRSEKTSNALVVNFGNERTYLTIISNRRLILDRMARFGEQPLLEELQRALDMSTDTARSLAYQYGVGPEPGGLAVGSDLTNADEIAGTVLGILKPAFGVLCEEIAKVLIYHASQMRGESVDVVYLLGSVARWPGIDRLLAGLLSLPVTTLNPISSFANSAQWFERADLDPVADLAIATGCALRETAVYG